MKSNASIVLVLPLVMIGSLTRTAFAEDPASDSRVASSSMDSSDERIGDSRASNNVLPQGFHTESQPRKDLGYAGGIVFGVSYTLSVVVCAALIRGDALTSVPAWVLIVPVAGPFTMLPSTKTKGDFTIFLADGIAQAAGVAMIISSFVWPRTVLVRNRSANVMLAPMRLGADGNGVGLMGTF